MDGLLRHCFCIGGLVVIMKRLLAKAVEALLVLLFSAFLAVLFIEWFAGCGETYIDANGVRHQYECVFLTHNFTLKEYFK